MMATGWELIEKRTARPVCDRCHRVRVKVSRGTICDGCRDSVLAEILVDYERQISAGVPEHQRWVLIPLGKMFDANFEKRLRAAVGELDAKPKRRRGVAV